VVLFQLANAALLPLALNSLTHRQGVSGFLVSATIIVPQVITAALAPWAGRLAQRVGRRHVLIVGFAAVPIRGLLFAMRCRGHFRWPRFRPWTASVRPSSG
jgi:MFS family permease